ncbi:MAG: glycosyltransferase family 2 protein [Lachnospiraceae bacterium]|jgi:glycosyltransferase involved in cell wall biosynthesis|nr:glycosyltransferase family 2 protein [Lachnospiraceae bacterium]
MQYNNYSGDDLTFVVCAYKECRYLDRSVRALVRQTVKPHAVIISTSTPNEFIDKVALKYGLEVRVNPHGGQIEDYNFALKQADTELVMLAHQDDILSRRFAEKVIKALNHAKDPIIAFTDYKEMHNDKVDDSQSLMIKIKKILLLPLKSSKLSYTNFGKRLALRFGDPITHPSVVNVMKKIPEDPFKKDFHACMDYDLWERLSKVQGSFVYVDRILLHHRMNNDNQSAKLIKGSNDRYDEELDIFCRFWPKPIAKFIMKFYKSAYKYY